ncbi:MAG TPA: hypothetical protein VGJ84_10035 [Polyangiaceae bacterium]|jgi:hypothetical protein
MRGFLIGLSVSVAFIIGCVAGASRFVLPPAEAAYVVEQRWAYFCFQESDADELGVKANAAGARGWELVAATTSKSGGDGKAVWCFRQPRP